MKTSSKQRRTSTTSSAGSRKRRKPGEASLPYQDWLVERLKDPAEAAAYLEAAIEQGDQPALMLALRQVAMAQGGIAEVARRAKLTREAAYRMLSNSGNPELRSLVAILSAAGLQLSIRPSGRTPEVAQERAGYRVRRFDYVKLAATTGSTGFREPLHEEELVAALQSGKLPIRKMPHLRRLLEDSPPSLVRHLLAQVSQSSSRTQLKKSFVALVKALDVQLRPEWMETV